jgi:TRAP-type mannitol/chloroaromatic compound transport system permease small subunit
MKHSQTIGILLTLLLFFCTTQPLVIIESRNWVVTGWDAGATNFGQSGKFLFYIGILAIVFFAIPSINVKRFNMAWAALLVAWSFRNYLVLSTCAMGECPQKQWALYACIILSFAILAMTFLPKLKTK